MLSEKISASAFYLINHNKRDLSLEILSWNMVSSNAEQHVLLFACGMDTAGGRKCLLSQLHYNQSRG